MIFLAKKPEKWKLNILVVPEGKEIPQDCPKELTVVKKSLWSHCGEIYSGFFRAMNGRG